MLVERSPLSASAEEVVYEVPVPPNGPTRFRARFFARDGETTRRLTNGGVGFGRAVPLLFRSLEVTLALADEAKRRGLLRALPGVLEPLR